MPSILNLVSVSVHGRDARDVGPLLLDGHRIGVRAFGPPLNALRISPNLAVSDAELDGALDVMASLGA